MTHHSSQVQERGYVNPELWRFSVALAQRGCRRVGWNRPGQGQADPALGSYFDNPLSFRESGVASLTNHPDNLAHQGMVGMDHANISQIRVFFRGIVLCMPRH
jgi:hypothetical protein